MASLLALYCDPCRETKESKAAYAFCLECRDIYCADCNENHLKLTVGKVHNYVKLQGTEESHVCDICSRGYAIQVADTFCSECREVYCETCSSYHREYEQTREHLLLNLKQGLFSNKTGILSHSVSSKTQENEDGIIKTTPLGTPTKGNNSDDQIIKQEGDIKTEMENGKQDRKIITSEDKQEPEIKAAEKQCYVVAKFLSEFSVKSESDVKPCNVNRMILMPNGEILIVDNANYKMKLFTETFLFRLEKTIPPLCTAVSYIDETTIVLTLRGAIRFYNIGKTSISETQKEIRINGGICDILHTNGTFIACFQKGSDACLGDLNMDGSMRVIRKEKNRILNHYDFLKFDQIHSLIFQTNFDKGVLTCIARDGNTLWTANVVGGPAGLAVGKESVFVAVNGKDKIQQYSLGGDLMNGLFLTPNDGIYRPYALGFNMATDTLFVTKNYQYKVSVFSVKEREPTGN